MKDVKRIVFWGKFVGKAIIIYGVIVAIQGLLSPFIGVIPGILAIFVGRLINSTGLQAEELLYSKGKNAYAVDMILKSIGKSFLIIGIITLIFIVFFGLYLFIVWVD